MAALLAVHTGYCQDNGKKRNAVTSKIKERNAHDVSTKSVTFHEIARWHLWLRLTTLWSSLAA